MSNAEHIEILRHDTAHIMAMAVQELFPDTQVTIGPVIENGFFYDFARDNPFTESDLEIIEKKMKDIQEQRTVLTEKEKQLEKLATEKDWAEVDNDNSK